MTGHPKKTYIAAADMLRVFAVGLVACFHIWQQSWFDPGFTFLGVRFDLQRIIRRGYMGVDLMLMLSGFLLYLPVARSRRMPDTREFYSRRLWRILPSYWFALAVCSVYTLLNGPDFGSPPLWQDLAAHLTFTHTFRRETYLWSNLNVGLWTLAVEMQFYLLFPMIGRAFLRRPGLTFVAMTALGVGFRLAITPREDVTILFNQLPCMLDLDACGMLAAHLLPRRRGGRLWARPAALLCLAGILWVLWIQSPANSRDLNQWQMNWRLPLGVLGGAFLWFGSQWGSGWDGVLGNPLTKWCASISYNFYIWHQYLAVRLKLWHIPPYQSVDMPQMREGRAWQLRYALVCFAAAFAAAALVTALVEKPAATLRRSRSAEKETVT